MFVKKRHFHPVPDVWSLKSEKIKYREDLELSEYVRSLLLAFVEAELLAVEVRVFKAFIFYFFLFLRARVFGFSSHDKSGKSEKKTFHAAASFNPKWTSRAGRLLEEQALQLFSNCK